MIPYKYRAKVINVVDGDTFDAEVDLGFRVFSKLRFRLKGIDTPEIYRPSCEAELQHGRAAKQRVEDLILNKEVIIESYKTGKYGRWIATVHIPDQETTLHEVLASEGFYKRLKQEYLEGKYDPTE